MAGTLKIKDLPIEARPREAFMRSAAPEREIPDASLLAILIRTGRIGSSAIDLAHRLINHFGSAAKLVEATWQQIVAAKVSGIGKVAAVQLAADSFSVTGSSSVWPRASRTITVRESSSPQREQ